MLAAGGAAGLAGSLVSCPSEHIRTKMQLQRRAQLAAKMGMSLQASGRAGGRASTPLGPASGRAAR